MRSLRPQRPSNRQEAIFAGLPAAVDPPQVDTVTIPFASVDDAVEQMLAFSGPWQMLFEALSANGAGPVARAALGDHLARFTHPAGHGVLLEAAYAVARIRPTAEASPL